MATFKVLQDKRYKRKDNSYRYCLRAIVDGKVHYLPLKLALSEKQHNDVFIKKVMSKSYIDLRDEINNLEIKAQRIYSSMKIFDYIRFKQKFYGTDEIDEENDPELPQTLAIKGLFNYYIDHADIKDATKVHMRVARNMLEAFHPNVYVDDINVKFLRAFEKSHADKGKSTLTISSYLRDLRTVINYFRNEKKIIPSNIKYVFGHGGYSIKSFRKKKSVLQDEEILKVIEMEDFESDKQEYARNLWLLMYYGSGINPVDLLKLRWKDIENDHAHFVRTKTETTRKDIEEITIPLTEEFKFYLNKVCDPLSPFVLGNLKQGYSGKTLLNRKLRMRKEVNKELRAIRTKLNLKAPLLMGTARHAYASSLKRSGVPEGFIGEMLGHSDPRTTMHYLDSLDVKKTFDVNKHLVKSTKNGIAKKDVDEK
ncbi:MAG TPA: tyrosine-type recombinase/integrase [Draconibacterium sp.]|nr:tyrosine-type recombinase/integrase [Draconibacterium sp.]